MGEISKILSTLFLRIDSLVYGFISVLYQKFIALASLKMFNDAIYARIENMVFMIVGVLALFLIAYNLLKHMIDADLTKSTADVKKVVINLVTSMFMIMLIPITFNLLFSVQNAILKQDLIGKLFQPYTTDFENSEHLNSCLLDSKVLVYNEETDEFMESSDSDTVTNVKLKCYGNLAALQMFQGFFYPTSVDDAAHTESYKNGASLTETLNNAAASVHPESASFLEWIGKIGKFAVEPFPMKIITVINAIRNAGESTDEDFSLADAYDVVIASGDFGILELFTENIESGEIKYTFLVSTIAGGFACYVLFLYCLDVAVRAVKLAFYQMIAPLPIMMRIVPKKGTDIFNNWLKCVSTTYFEIFSRLAILYFGMYFISNIFVLMGEGMSSSNIGYDLMSGSLFGVGVWLLVKANIILGIFAFMKKAPELLKQIVPSSDKFSLKLWDHLKDSFAVPAAIGGFAGGMIAGGGNPLAGFRAAAKGWNDSSLAGIGAEHKRRLAKLEADRQSRAAGQSTTERMKQRMLERGRGIIGYETRQEEADRLLKAGRNLDRQTITVTNSTATDIQLADGTVISAGQSDIQMNQSMQELIQTTLKNNATEYSKIVEETANTDNAISSNQEVLNVVSKIEDKARQKVASSNIKWGVMDENGHELMLNLSQLDEHIETRRQQGAKEEEMRALKTIRDAFDKDIWKEFANASMTAQYNDLGEIINEGNYKVRHFTLNTKSGEIGENTETRTMVKVGDTDIKSSENVLRNSIHYRNILKDEHGETSSYTGDTDEGIVFIDNVKGFAKEANHRMNEGKVQADARKEALKAQKEGLEKLNTGLKEEVERVQESNEYRAIKSNSEYIKNQNNNGGH